MNIVKSLTQKQQYWHEHLERAEQSELSLSAYAREHELDLKSLYRFQHILRGKGLLTPASTPKSKAFVQLTSSPTGKVMTNDTGAIRIVFRSGHRVELPTHGVDLESLLRTVSAL